MTLVKIYKENNQKFVELELTEFEKGFIDFVCAFQYSNGYVLEKKELVNEKKQTYLLKFKKEF